MMRIKEAQESRNKPRLDRPAVKRFVSSALWQKKLKKSDETGATRDQSASQTDQPVGKTKNDGIE